MSPRKMLALTLIILSLIMGTLLLLMRREEKRGNNKDYWMIVITCFLISVLSIKLLVIAVTY